MLIRTVGENPTFRGVRRGLKVDMAKLERGEYTFADLAEIDEAGYYKILGRSKDQINIKGVKLNPLSLEKQLLETIPGLTECAIFGEDRVKCIFVGNCDKDAIVNFLLTLGSHCRPALLECVDSIPISPSGKVSRTHLDKLYLT